MLSVNLTGSVFDSGLIWSGLWAHLMHKSVMSILSTFTPGDLLIGIFQMERWKYGIACEHQVDRVMQANGAAVSVMQANAAAVSVNRGTQVGVSSSDEGSLWKMLGSLLGG